MMDTDKSAAFDGDAPVLPYCRPALTDLSYVQVVSGLSCTGLPDSGEEDCDPDLFTE